MLLRSFFAGITRLSLRFKWITIGLTVIFLVLGVVSALQLNQELLPRIEFPQTIVVALRPGASTDDMRDLVTVPLEQEVAKVKGVVLAGLESTTSSPVSGISVVSLIVRFDYGVEPKLIQSQIKAAIDKVAAEGVPTGLKTTADLTPEIMTNVLMKAPSMWKHFEGKHFQAMPIEVLNAALAVNPDFINQVDLLTRDQLAARRVDTILTATPVKPEPVELPRGWRVTKPVEAVASSNLDLNNNQPQIVAFSLSDLPILNASISSTAKDLTPEKLREFVNQELVAELKALPDVANVSLGGGQIIPNEVTDAAIKVVEQEQLNNGKVGEPQQPKQPQQPQQPAQPETSQVPALPPQWIAQNGFLGLTSQLLVTSKIRVQFRDASDLLKATNADGKTLTAAQVLNAVAENNTSLLGFLTSDVLAYLRSKEPALVANLSEKALEQVAWGITNNGAWAQLAAQAGFKQAKIATLADLARFKGSVAKTINAIVENTNDAPSFAIRIVDGLTPEAIAYLLRKEPDFLAALNPQTLRYMSGATLSALPEGFIEGLKDAALVADLKAIMADPTKSAGAALAAEAAKGQPKVVDDPNAPPMPESWVKALGQFGFNIKTANDLFKPPFGNAARFFNQSAASPGAGNLMKDIPAELLIYLQGREPKFFEGLTDNTLSQFTPEVIAKLPADVQARAGGNAFIPKTTVTRANGQASLVLSVVKRNDANTVAVAHQVDEVFAKIKAKYPDVVITPVFEQAPFIEESIEGVAREGALGAVGAVVVILFFLNFSVRSTLVTAVSIPTSIAIALILMRWVPETMHIFIDSIAPSPGAPLEFLHTLLLRLFPSNMTLNIMTLSGLTVAIGRVVDDSIVVLENIYRQLQKGVPAYEAALNGARDVSLAIFAATLTTVVVFLPIGLTGGVVGEFFLPFGLAVTYALVASFFVALTTVPLLAYMFISSKNLKEEKEGRLEVLYHNTLNWALSNRLAVLGIAGATFAVGILLFATRPTTFLPSLGEPQITISVTMPSGAQLAQTDVRAREMEKFLESKKGKGILRYQTTVGSRGGLESFFGGGSGVDGGAAQIVAAVDATGEKLNTLTAEVRAEAEKIFGAKAAKVSRASISEQGFGGFAVVVSGPDADVRAADAEIIATLSTVKGLTNVTSTLNQAGASASYLRVGLQTAVKYSAELEAQDTLGLTREAIAAVKALPSLPKTVTAGEGFQSQQQTEGFRQTFGAMGTAIVIVYLVMVLTFGSLVHPFTILFTLPLAVVGAAFGLWITNRVLGISALVGMLMLIGIVVTNAIVMLDRVQQNRKEKGMRSREALVEGARTRLRPILMTALGTMVALFPLAAGFSKGAIIATELGTVVIGGLFSSTLLTLLVVPVVYSLFDAAQRRVLGKRQTSEQPAVASGD